MSTTDDDMVVAYGMLEQVRLQIDVERNLRATEMVAIRRFHSFCLGNEIMVELRAAPFE